MSGNAENKPVLFANGKRHDGRKRNELRKPLKITAGVLERADGSALIEWGTNKVLAGVYGPREPMPKHIGNPYKATVICRYIMAPFSGSEEHGRSGPNRRSREISKVITHLFENIILTEKFPNSMIEIQMEVLQSDGGTRIAAATCAAVALADAGIPLKDLPAGVAAGKCDGEVLCDLDKIEDNYGSSDMAGIVSLRTGELLLMQMEGLLSRKEVEQSIDLVFEGAKQVRLAQVESLKKKFAEDYEDSESEK